jgi:hypothetical protein
MKICNYEAQCILMNMKRKFNEYEALKVNITRRSLRGPGGEVSRIIGWDTTFHGRNLHISSTKMHLEALFLLCLTHHY